MALGILATGANIILILSVSINSIWCLELLEVNVTATVSLSQGFMEALRFYLQPSNQGITTIRPDLKDQLKTITTILPDLKDQLKSPIAVKLSQICQTLPICKNSSVIGVEGYILQINDAIQDTFLKELNKDEEMDKAIKAVFNNETEQETLVKDIRELLLDATNRLNATADESTGAWVWIGLLKRIHNRMLIYADQNVIQLMELNNVELAKTIAIQMKFMRKLLPNTDSIENSFEYKIYVRNNVLEQPEFYRCTALLHEVLLDLKNAPLKTAEKFMMTFYYSLTKTNFFMLLEDQPARALKDVLIEMAFTKKEAAKKALTTALLTVEDRVNILEGNTSWSRKQIPYQQLLYAILSDLDYMFSEEAVLLNRLQEEFHSWSQHGGDLKTILDQFLADCTGVLDTQPPELLDKLWINVKVFLEYTIESDV